MPTVGLVTGGGGLERSRGAGQRVLSVGWGGCVLFWLVGGVGGPVLKCWWWECARVVGGRCVGVGCWVGRNNMEDAVFGVGGRSGYDARLGWLAIAGWVERLVLGVTGPCGLAWRVIRVGQRAMGWFGEWRFISGFVMGVGCGRVWCWGCVVWCVELVEVAGGAGPVGRFGFLLVCGLGFCGCGDRVAVRVCVLLCPLRSVRAALFWCRVQQLRAKIC